MPQLQTLPFHPSNDPQVGGKAQRANLLATQPFGDTFGPQRRRKRPKLTAEGLEALVARAEAVQEGFEVKTEGGAPGDVFDDMKDAVSGGQRLLCADCGVDSCVLFAGPGVSIVGSVVRASMSV